MRSSFWAGALGNVFEWYDFSLYMFFASIFSKLFFPHQTSHIVAMLLVFVVFAIGYLMRPLGALLYGYVGDKHGRRKALLISILTMTGSAFLIGCLPTAQAAGGFAAVLLLLFRMIQGLSAGGETAGSFTYVLESQQQAKRGFFGAATFAMIVVGILLGSLVGVAIQFLFSKQQILAGAWRLPYLISIFLGLIILLLRSRMAETPEFQELQNQHKIISNPTWHMLSRCNNQLLRIFGLCALAAASFYFVFAYLPNLVCVPGEGRGAILVSNSISMLVLLIAMIGFGKIANTASKRKMLTVSGVLMLLLSYPLMALVAKHCALFLPVQIFFAILIALFEAPLPALLIEMTSVESRYSLISFGYNVSFAVFGGLAPVATISLLEYSPTSALPSAYLIFCAVISLLSILLIRRRNFA